MDTLKEHLGKVLVLVKQQVVGLQFLISLKNEPVFLHAFRPKASKNCIIGKFRAECKFLQGISRWLLSMINNYRIITTAYQSQCTDQRVASKKSKIVLEPLKKYLRDFRKRCKSKQKARFSSGKKSNEKAILKKIGLEKTIITFGQIVNQMYIYILYICI